MLADPRMIEMHLTNPNVVGIKASFNAFGHKQWVEDPDWWDDLAGDHGSKVFTYSALGEVLTEIDPEGNLIEMLYDSLGRLIQRKVNGTLHAKWYFDNPDINKGIGLLDLEDSQFRADGSRLQKFYYYSDVTTGRKDLLQVTHRFYENNDSNDFVDYATQFFTDGFYARPKGLRYPGGTSLAYEYNTNGHVIREKDPTSTVIYREITKRGSRNQITESRVANATGGSGGHQYFVTTTYFSETGQAESMSVSNGSTQAQYQSLSYTYEHFGNLDTRHTSVGGGTTEFFHYDDLQRLIETERDYGAGIVAADTVNYSYDSSGSFLSKSDFAASYSYNISRPHVVASAGGATYSHDQNGNVTGRDGDTIDYNAFNKPTHISNASLETRFTYGADLSRYMQITPQGSTIFYIDKLMEIESSGSAVDFRHYLGDVVILTKTGDLGDPTPGVRYTFRDRLGGISMLGDETGLVTEFRGYDAFGKPRASNWANKTPATINSSVTDRGFTDHEHLDDWQLIHMNGRGYDYNLGRFLSMDPFIQDPGNSQSINAFAYIMNNPLSGTDPSGYCGTASRIDGGGGSSPCTGGQSEFDQQLQDPDSAVVFQDKDGSYFAVTADNNGNLTKWTNSTTTNGDGSGTNTTEIGPIGGGDKGQFRSAEFGEPIAWDSIPGQNQHNTRLKDTFDDAIDGTISAGSNQRERIDLANRNPEFDRSLASQELSGEDFGGLIYEEYGISYRNYDGVVRYRYPVTIDLLYGYTGFNKPIGLGSTTFNNENIYSKSVAAIYVNISSSAEARYGRNFDIAEYYKPYVRTFDAPAYVQFRENVYKLDSSGCSVFRGESGHGC